MGRQKVSAKQQKEVISTRKELTNTVKSIDNFRPYIKELLISTQHLWIMSNRYMVSTDDIDAEKNAPNHLKHLWIIREFHERILRVDIDLVRIRTLIVKQYLSELKTLQNALEIQSAYIQAVLPFVSGVNSAIVDYLVPLSVVFDIYSEKIKETIGEEFYNSMTSILLNINERKLANDTGTDVVSPTLTDQLVAESMVAESLNNEVVTESADCLTLDEISPVIVEEKTI